MSRETPDNVFLTAGQERRQLGMNGTCRTATRCKKRSGPAYVGFAGGKREGGIKEEERWRRKGRREGRKERRGPKREEREKKGGKIKREKKGKSG